MKDVNVISTGIIEILEYLKSAFDDETTLDALPLEAAGNPGAWNAWKAHRKSGFRNSEIEMHDPSRLESGKQPAGTKIEGYQKPPEEWSWDGVWEERVKKGVDSSISDPALYGIGSGGDDLVSREIHPRR